MGYNILAGNEPHCHGTKDLGGSEEWIASEFSTMQAREVSDESRRLLASLGWDAQMTVYETCTTTLQLSQYLGAEWIADDLIDMMMSHLSARNAADPNAASEIVIAPLYFAFAVEQAYHTNDYSPSVHPFLRALEARMKEPGRRWLFFPVFVTPGHWIAMFIDFEKKSFSYGRSHCEHFTGLA